jgi:glutathione S-transferase
MPYQYCETDPFKRPTQLLEANPRGLVPAIRQGDWASGESTVILEYVSVGEARALSGLVIAHNEYIARGL